MMLLTGASGFLGRVIKSQYIKGCTSLGRSVESDLICDLSKSIPNLPNFDVVVHAAGKAHSVPKNEEERREFFVVNVDGTKNLLRGLSLSKILPKSFVFISTVAVYGLESGININEKTSLQATDPYGLSKIQAENLVIEWCQTNGVICTVLRLPLVAGPNPPGNLGAMIKGIRKGYYANIANGSAKKSIVLASDVAEIIIKVAGIGGIYNLTDNYHPSFSELSINIAKQLGKKKPMNIPTFLANIMAYAGDLCGAGSPINTIKLRKITSILTFDDSRAKEKLGWNPTAVLDGFKIT